MASTIERVFVQFQASINGLTGRIEFEEGKRNNFKIDLLKLRREHLVKVGYWSPSEHINITDPQAFYETTVPNITLVVMTREVGSFFFWFFFILHFVDRYDCLAIIILIVVVIVIAV